MCVRLFRVFFDDEEFKSKIHKVELCFSSLSIFTAVRMRGGEGKEQTFVCTGMRDLIRRIESCFYLEKQNEKKRKIRLFCL